MVRKLRCLSKTVKTPKRPFEKQRLDHELKLCGQFGLRCKREVWRVHLAIAKLRKQARYLLTLPEKDPRRIFEGDALLRRVLRYGLLDETKMKLDYVLGLHIEDFLERRLQTIIFKAGLAKSIHHARLLITQRHIRVGRQVVNVPSYLVRTATAGNIDFTLSSPYNRHSGRPGRVRRRTLKSKGNSGGGDDAAGSDEE